jgi:YVTN family beta-propeller protein
VGPGPSSLDVSRDGKYVYVYTSNPSPGNEVVVYTINCEKPDSCYSETSCVIAVGNGALANSNNQIRMAPQGTYGIITLGTLGFYQWAIPCGSGGGAAYPTSLNRDYTFTPDGRRIYATGSGGSGIQMYDFLAAQKIIAASGNNQTGVTNTVLPAPIRVQVQSSSADPLDGVPVTFTALNNGMLLTADGPKSETIVATDAGGFAEVRWQLGDVGANQVTVSATGLSGSPFNFSATAVVDPSTLPLSLAEVVPLAGATNVSPTTALLATFSRAVEPASIGASTVYLRNVATTTTVPATYGFTDANRRVSLTPSAALTLGTAYELVLTAGVQAASAGGPLTNPGQSGFTTLTAVPLYLSSVSPPSALRGVNIVIAGTGFSSTLSANTVLFNSVPATPISGGPGSLVVKVPVGAVSGTVQVQVGAVLSNPRAFTVLLPNTSPIDEVIATVPAGAGAKSCAVSPDGALVYTVSPEGNVVIPVDVSGGSTFASIPVGDQPVAIVIHPNGLVAYVANFNSGTVSVIDIDPTSSTFNTVIRSISVGTNPADLATDPDGSRLVVANAGSSNISIVDADQTSTTYDQVLVTVPSGAGARSVAVSPDGTIYVGTNTGFGYINMFASVHHGKWVSDPTEPWQNACWCVLVEEGKVERLKARLRNTAVEFDQDSIAWAEAPHTEFIGASS